MDRMARNSLLVLLLLVAAASAAVPVFNGDAKEKVEADSADGNDDAVLWLKGLQQQQGCISSLEMEEIRPTN